MAAGICGQGRVVEQEAIDRPLFTVPTGAERLLARSQNAEFNKQAGVRPARHVAVNEIECCGSYPLNAVRFMRALTANVRPRSMRIFHYVFTFAMPIALFCASGLYFASVGWRDEPWRHRPVGWYWGDFGALRS